MSIAAFVVSLVALAVAVWAAVQSTRSASAGVASAGESKRANDRLDRLDEVQAEREAEEVTAGRVDWSITRYRGDTFRLFNGGTHDAAGVTVHAGKALLKGQPEDVTVASQDAVEFHIIAAGGHPIPPSLLVTWSQNPTGERIRVEGRK